MAQELPNVFNYFAEGKFGIKERFARQICKGLEEYSLKPEDLDKEAGLTNGTIAAIVAGDRNGINSHLLQEIADPVGLKFEEAFGEVVNFTEHDQALWTEQANQERFVALAGGDEIHWTPARRAQLFIRIKALRAL